MVIENENIYVIGAQEKNLNNLTVKIPKHKITVVTGVSGSGKSSLVFDTLAAESQRQLNETYSSFLRHRMPHYGRPKIDCIKNLPVAFVINQKRLGGNARSTVGTITDIYSLLRLLFSRLGEPHVGDAEAFSFNNPSGMCPRCEGIGKVDLINVDKLLDREKSLNEGAILFPTFYPGDWRWKRYVHSGLFDNDKKIKDYSAEELDTLLHKSGFKLKTADPEWPKTSVYEGIIPRIERSFLKNETVSAVVHKNAVDFVIEHGMCPLCCESRLKTEVLRSKINEKNIADCSAMEIVDLLKFINTVKHPLGATILETLRKQLEQMIAIGLGYLSLNRETSTLSGGESQRIKIVRQLGSSLTDVLYIFDEPSVGLHADDVEKINDLLQFLRDKGNTVIIIEHDPDVIKIADHVVDIGPGAGKNGGNVIFEGNFEDLRFSDTPTGHFINKKISLKQNIRKFSDFLHIKNANSHNLKNVSVEIPMGAMTVVTGVAGSGKSTLIFKELVSRYPKIISIDQKCIHTSGRSNVATSFEIFDDIRELYATTNNVSPSLFSFNSRGACDECNGLGFIYTDMAFMDEVACVCEKCGGKRYAEQVLQYHFHGKNISDILAMNIDEAISFFRNFAEKELRGKEINVHLQKLQEVGLGYVALGQSLDTMSGGELQRLKLASELRKKGNIYLMDEPTTGLHMSDVDNLLQLLNKIVDDGNTLVIIEHNTHIISQADWIIDLGPGAGKDGGSVLFCGPLPEFINCECSITEKYLNALIASDRVSFESK
jgi:excinuclease UvrABC ATPase subunit